MTDIIHNPNAPLTTNTETSAASDWVVNVTTEQFEQEVIAKSQSTYVLVDFWAPWCQPCQGLKPILEKLAAEYNGAFTLALVNTDEEQMLAQQIGVRSLPTVVLIKDGGLVDQFTGGLPEQEVRAFLDKHVSAQADETEALPDGDALFAQGAYAEAAMAYQQRLQANDADVDALLGLADSYLQLDEAEAAKTIVDNLPVEHKNHDRAKAILVKMDFATLIKGAPAQADLSAKLEQDPNDLKTADLLGIRYLLSGQDEAALEVFLNMMKTDPSYEDGLPKQRLLQALNMIQDRKLVSKYRSKMASLVLI